MEINIGTKVHYHPNFGEDQNGVIKSHHPTDLTIIYIVYKCNNDWENFQNYTGEMTEIKDLREGWI